eukprot:366448-Chlamydomonas_euryale.AAC.1
MGRVGSIAESTRQSCADHREHPACMGDGTAHGTNGVGAGLPPAMGRVGSIAESTFPFAESLRSALTTTAAVSARVMEPDVVVSCMHTRVGWGGGKGGGGTRHERGWGDGRDG